MEELKNWLRKLGRTKFQAYLLVTIINAITLYAHFRGWTKEQVQIDPYMPILNVIVQAVATFVYQWVEGSIDREAQKQQVYVMPGSVPVPDETAAASASGTTNAAVQPADLPWSEVIARVKSVNAELNTYMTHLNKSNMTDVAKEAISRYLAVHDLLSAKGPLPPAQEGATADGSVPGQH